MNKKNIIYIIVTFLLLMGTFGIFSKRFDLTQEKRYTLSDTTIKVLESVKKPLTITVYLDGDFPASFRQLQNETKFILEEFRKVNPQIAFKFIDPIKTKMSKDSLAAMGIQPSILPDMKEGKISEIVMFPYSSIRYGARRTSVPLIVNITGIDASEQLSKSIENLEYNFISNIKTITADRKKKYRNSD